MRTDNIMVKITIPIPYDRPDLNNVMYSRDAVKNAIENIPANLPILFRDGSNISRVVGNTMNKTPEAVWDDENKICNVSIDGVIYHGGTECVADIENGTISSFSITGIGISI